MDSKSLNKLIKGGKIIVKNSDTGHEISLMINDKKVYNRLEKALNNRKGATIDGEKDIVEILMPDVVNGQGIMRKLKRGFNKIGKSTEKAFNQVETHLNKNAGNYVETAKKIVPKSAVKGLTNAAILAGTTYIGQPQLAPVLMKASNLGVNTLYNKDYKQPLNKGWEKALKNGLIQSANEEINSAMKNGFKSDNSVPMQEAIPIKDGMGFKRKTLKNINPVIPSKQRKPIALQNKVPIGGSYKPLSGKGLKNKKITASGFKAIGNGFMPIG